MSTSNFDKLAWCYDGLQRVVFGKSVLEKSVRHFEHLSSESRILVLGGGTGQVLKHLPASCIVDYVDESEKMVNEARKCRIEKTFFYVEDFVEWKTSWQYDAVICPFFLDCFDPENLKNVLFKIRSLLKEEGKLLVSDFSEPKNPTQHFLINTMLLFFRYTVNLKAKKLLPLQRIIESYGFSEISESRGFVFSSMFKKT